MGETRDHVCVLATAPTDGNSNRTAALILKSGTTLRRQGVDFDQGVAGGVVFAAHNRGSITGCPGDDYGGFAVVGRGLSSRLNFRLLGVLPVIVRGNLLAVSVKDGKNRIG